MKIREGREPTAETIAEFQSEMPDLLTDSETVLAQEPENRAIDFYHAMIWLENQQGKGAYEEENIREQLGLVKHGMGRIWFEIRQKLIEEERWRDNDWRKWPRHYPGRDTMHLYHTGMMSPQYLVWPHDEQPFPHEDHSVSRPILEEFLAWSYTIVAVQIGMSIESLRESVTKTLESFAETDKRYAAWKQAEEREKQALADYEVALWMDGACRSGRMEAWAAQYRLAGLANLLHRLKTFQIKEVSIPGEVLKVDSDFAALEKALALTSPADSKRIGQFRALNARDAWKPYGNA